MVVREFVAQRDDVTLVLFCDDPSAVLMHELLEQMEDSEPSAMYWLVTEDFTDPVTYTNVVVNSFAAKHGAVALALRDAGSTPWPPIPTSVLDESRMPAERLRALMTFSRTAVALPRRHGCGMVYASVEHLRPARVAAHLMHQV